MYKHENQCQYRNCARFLFFFCLVFFFVFFCIFFLFFVFCFLFFYLQPSCSLLIIFFPSISFIFYFVFFVFNAVSPCNTNYLCVTYNMWHYLCKFCCLKISSEKECQFFLNQLYAYTTSHKGYNVLRQQRCDILQRVAENQNIGFQ